MKKPGLEELLLRTKAESLLGPLSEPMEFDAGNILILSIGAITIIGIIACHFLFGSPP